MSNDTKNQILEFITTEDGVKPADIYAHFSINRQMVHRHLKNLLTDKKIKKIGSAPKVFYYITDDVVQNNIVIDAKYRQIITAKFLFIEPTGIELSGINGFISWCQKRDFNPQQKAIEFSKIMTKYKKNNELSLIDATHKINKTFVKNTSVNQLFYYDFYAVEIFGKTKIGQQLLYAKQGQNKQKIKEIIATIRQPIIKLIATKKIDAIIFVPPTVPRILQFMHLLKTGLALNLPQIKVAKVFADIRVPQKTLKKLTDRIDNANHSFVIEDKITFNKVLIIDDAVGSGASINQIAHKLKMRKQAKTIIGFAITGSLNDFEIISEV